MAKLGVHLGLTLQIGEREFIRPEITIDEIDVSLPLKPQLDAAMGAVDEVFKVVAEALFTKTGEYLQGVKGNGH